MKPPQSRIREAIAVLGRYWNCRPRAAIILGTGMSDFARQIDVDIAIPYQRLPHFPNCTADGHNGRLLCGRLRDVPVVAMDGRCHVYEGHSLDAITMPVRFMRALGAELLILSNAAGGMNPSYSRGDIMIVEDHINLMGRKPLLDGPATKRADTAGRASSATRTYCPRLIADALDAAQVAGFTAHRGVYVAMTGPNYETRAEYRFLREIGGDAVGMSTVPEAIAGADCGLHVLALSAITNICMPDDLATATHGDVMEAAAAAESKLRAIVLDVVAGLGPEAALADDAVAADIA